MKPTHHHDTKAYHDYYIHQSGKGYPVFAGRRYQRGHGLGSIVGGLFKAAIPLLRKGANTIGREALTAGLHIAGDVVEGRNIKQAAESRLKSKGQNLFQKAMDTVDPQDNELLKDLPSEKRSDVGRLSNGTHRMIFSDKNGTCTPQLMRIHEISVEHGYWEQKGLTSTLTDQGPYEFAVSGAADEYIDLANTYLFVEAQIVADDDSALDAGEDVGLVYLWMHFLFSDVSVSLNEKLVLPPTSLYLYRAYI